MGDAQQLRLEACHPPLEYARGRSGDSRGSRPSGSPRGPRHLRSSTSSLARASSLASSRIAGFRSQDEPPTREALMEQGVEGEDVDAVLARLHEEEVLVRSFYGYIHLFSILVCLLTPCMLGVTAWMLVEYLRSRGVTCDEPLQMWCLVVFGATAFNATVNRPRRGGSWVTRVLCMHDPDETVPSLMPLRVRLYNVAVALFVFAWNLYGVFLVAAPARPEAAREPRPCAAAAPGLHASAKVYVCLNLVFTAFVYVNMVGFNRFLAHMMRRGALRSDAAAPKGTLEGSTEPMPRADSTLSEQATCSICLDDLAAGGAVKTRACGHAFHRQCLQGWLNVNRSCPVCRFDLADGSKNTERGG